MRLTRYTDYSLRVLMYLAVRPDGFGTVQSIAEAYDISRNHLMKVVQRLNKRGYIETVRGKGGGMRLGLAPAKINVGHVVSDMESDFAIVECLGECNRCVITPECMLKDIMADAHGAFMRVLGRYTLADLTRHHEPLQHLLHMPEVELEVS